MNQHTGLCIIFGLENTILLLCCMLRKLDLQGRWEKYVYFLKWYKSE